jgi:cupin fold WbuC family metalloprotein
MQIIDEELLDTITLEAKENNRLRKNYNLHKSFDEKVQRLLNALEPGTEIPVHCHKHTAETYFVLRGRLIVHFYDRNKNLKRSEMLSPIDGKYGISIPEGEWHSIEVLEKGTIIFEVKEGPYRPLKEEEILL